jgi:hypothetical protein
LWNGKCHIAGAISRYINDSPVGQLAVIMDPDVKLYNESERLSIPGKAGRTRGSPTISSEILEKVTRLIYYIVSEGPSHEHHRIGGKNRVAGNQVQMKSLRRIGGVILCRILLQVFSPNSEAPITDSEGLSLEDPMSGSLPSEDPTIYAEVMASPQTE